MKVILSNEEARSLAQNRLIKPVTGFASDEDVATLLDCWSWFVGSGTPWNRVVKVWEGDGFYFFECSPEGTIAGDFSIFDFIKAGRPDVDELNPVTARTRFSKGRGLPSSTPNTQIWNPTEGVYLGDLMGMADRSDNKNTMNGLLGSHSTSTADNQPQAKENVVSQEPQGVVTNLHNPSLPGEWVLLPQDNSVSGAQIKITTGGKVVVGRDGNSVDLILIDPKRTISRRHCIFSEHEGVLKVADLNSSNGVRVNHHRINGESVLNPHDLVQVGAVPFLVTKVG